MSSIIYFLFRVLALFLLIGPSVQQSLLVALVCIDEVSCDAYSSIQALNVLQSYSVSTRTPYQSAVNVSLTTKTDASSSLPSALPTVVIHIIIPSAEMTTDSSISTSAIYFSILAAVQRVEGDQQRTISMLIVPDTLQSVVSSAAQQLRRYYVLVYFAPATAAVDDDYSSSSMQTVCQQDTFCIGKVVYYLGSALYVVGAVAAATSQSGFLGLTTGPSVEPARSIHAFIRESVRGQCPTCTLQTAYFPTDAMINASRYVSLLQKSSFVNSSVDFLIVQASTRVFTEIQKQMQGIPELSRFRLLCAMCEGGLVNISFIADPVLSYLTLRGAAASVSIVDGTLSHSSLDLSLDSVDGVSLVVCSGCLSQRALRAYADTATAVQTLFEDGGLKAIYRQLILPMMDDAPALSRHVSADTVIISDWSITVGDTLQGPSTPTTTMQALASTCHLANSELCVIVAVFSRFEKIVSYDGELNEWTTTAAQIEINSQTQEWKRAGNAFPDSGFSVDAVSSIDFLVFGGALLTSLLPVPQANMFRIRFLSRSPLTSVVDISLVTPTAASGGGGGTHTPVVPAARLLHAHVSVADVNGIHLYIHGGQGLGEALLQDLWRYDVIESTWTQLSSSSVARYDHRMLFLTRLQDPVLFIAAGNDLFSLDSVEYYSLNRSTWSSAPTDVPRPLSRCAIALQPTHIAFLSRPNLYPCVMDVVSLQVQCNLSDKASLSVNFPQYGTVENLNCQVVDLRGSPRRSDSQSIGILVVTETAKSSRDTSMVLFNSGMCSSTSSYVPATTTTTTAGTAGGCSNACGSGYFSFMYVCAPCDLSLIPLIWPWANISLSIGTLKSLTDAQYLSCSASSSSTSFNPVLVVVVVALVFFIIGASSGYLMWIALWGPLDDKALRNAPQTLPLTLLQLDIHASAALWRSSPEKHAKFLDEFVAAAAEAVAIARAYRVKRIGDGILVACRDVVVALRVIQLLRTVLLKRLRRSIQSGSIPLPTSTSAAASSDSGVAAANDSLLVDQHAKKLLSSVKCGVHSCHSVTFLYTLDEIQYEGEATLVPILILQSTRAGEVAFTMDSVAELERHHNSAVADGLYLRKHFSQTEFPEVTLESILNVLLKGDGSGTSTNLNERICLNGTHVRVMKTEQLLPPTCGNGTQTNDARITSPVDRSQAATSLETEASAAAAAGASSVMVASGVDGGGCVDVVTSSINVNPILQELDMIFDFIDNEDCCSGAITKEEFAAMRSLIAIIVRTAISSLEPAVQEKYIKMLVQQFAVSSFDKGLVKPMVIHRHEGNKLHFFHRLAARLVSMLHPALVKQHLLHCAAAGQAAVALGVGGAASSTVHPQT